MIYVFDGTYKGLLTAIFDSYANKAKDVKIVSSQFFEPDFFVECYEVVTDDIKAKRVVDGLKNKISTTSLKQFYSSFLSEDPIIFQHLYQYACYIFDSEKGADKNFGNEHVLAIAQMDRKVHREKHRMEAFIRFEKAANGMYFAIINPDFNVIPLLIKHFKSRYADQQWVIYDEKRKYGIHYDLETVCEVTFDTSMPENALVKSEEIMMDEKEELFSRLWRAYFKSTNIVERKNMKLHLQHVPKRYWKYLTEKK